MGPLTEINFRVFGLGVIRFGLRCGLSVVPTALATLLEPESH